MATFLDIVLLEEFSIVFTFLLVFAIMYAVLEFAKILGDNKGIHAVIALSVAVLMLISKSVLEVVNFTIPWFVILFIFSIFGIIAYKLFSGPDVDMSNMIKDNPVFRNIIIFAVIIIFIAGLGKVFGQNIGPYLGQQEQNTTVTENGEIPSTSTGSFSENLTATLFHPKILGMVLILLVGTFTIAFLAGRVQK